MTDQKPMARKDATATPRQRSREFVAAFLVSLFSMVAAALLYVFFGRDFAFDWRAQALVGVLTVLGVLIGLWMVRTGEKHAGYGVLFGSLFGVLLGAIGVTLIALLLLAYPVEGLF